MKRIYIYLLSAIASLAFAQVASAQSSTDILSTLEFPKEGSTSYTINNGVGVRKQVSSPLSDGSGTYYIKLEAFATGAASITSISKPADIILVLDCSSSMGDAYGSAYRIDALKTACKAFLETIRANDAAARALDSTYKGDRVAIVSFNTTATTVYNLSQINEYYSDMSDKIDGLTTASGTYSHLGLAAAMVQWQRDGAATTADPNRSRAVVFFTDGCPANTGSYNFKCEYAAAAVNNANSLKNDYGAKVYSVGLFDTSSSAWTSSNYLDWQNQVLDYMNFISSNFNTVTATYSSSGGSSGHGGDSSTPSISGKITYTINNGDTTLAQARASDSYADVNEAQAGSSKFFFMSSEDPSSLKSIFESIASQTGGAANTQLTAASTTTVDVVSDSFVLPEGAGDMIKVYTANCTNTTENMSPPYTFGTATLATFTVVTDPAQAPATGITVILDKANNKITVKGFDFKENWCGPEKNASGTVTGYHQGSELIILIPILANPNAIGGPNLETNIAGSGIYVEGNSTPVAQFISPTISLPVNIFIKKIGLRSGESAKFIIERATLPLPENPDDATWSYVTSVFVTNSTSAKLSEDGNPIVYVKGLPPTTGSGDDQIGYVYRVREEGWSWSYTYSTDPKYTVSDQSINPFTFTNEKRNDIYIRHHAESKATNVFKTGVTGGQYDDSKTNTRQ